MHQGAENLLRLRTDAKETTDKEDELLLFNVENGQVTNKEISHVHVCTKCDVK